MIDCNQKNTWGKQERKWSMIVIGIDKKGNALFIFTRTPYSVYDFINILLSLPISIHKAMYLEGGPEASIYINHNGIEIRKFGSYETGFVENDNNDGCITNESNNGSRIAIAKEASTMFLMDLFINIYWF